jgi:molybdopterin/thiamine biosynthesis adenylyltransferase
MGASKNPPVLLWRSPVHEFTEEQLERYGRHIILEEVGIEGQEKIIESRVLVIGAGGLGSPAALYLSAAGVGTIGIADSGRVAISNLQRQVIHFTSDTGRLKVQSAMEKMLAINPGIKVNAICEYLDCGNISQVIRDYDFIIDCTDNFESKFLINDACLFEKKTFSHGGILRFEGQTMTVRPRETACYRCIFNAPPPSNILPSCSQAGVLGPIAGMLGTIQAAEALKFITGAGELLYNQLLIFDARKMNFRKVKFGKNPSCPVCGEDPSIIDICP